MAFYLEALTGKHSGVKVSLYEGMTIGRKQGDLLLDDDPKVSGLHAKIILDNKNQFVLVDQDSSNGLVISGRKVKKIAMLPGVTFRIGGTHFRVIKEDTAIPNLGVSNTNIPSEAPEINSPPAEKHFTPPEFPRDPEPSYEPPPIFKTRDPLGKGPKVEERELQVKTWKERAEEIFSSREETEPQQFLKLGAFSPALILEFVEGPQTDQSLTVGYGPRQAGFHHLDLDLIDPKLPEKTFDLLPGPGSVEIRDLTGGQMIINGRPKSSHFLEEGDVIVIGQTKIKVRYL